MSLQSLAVCVQDGLWFSLGCAASKVGDVDLEVKAFHRSITLEPDVRSALCLSTLLCYCFYLHSFRKLGVTWVLHISRKKRSKWIVV